MISRKTFLFAALGMGSCSRREAVSGCGQMAGKTVRWVVPYPPGGSYDVYSRLLEAPLEKELGVEILVSNEPGGGGLIGASRIRDAARDGLTLGVVNAAGLFSGMMMAKTAVPNPARDFTVLGRITKTQSVLVTGARSGLRSVDDLLARQKQKPLVVAASGVAGNTLFSSATAASLLGLDVQYVSGYGGSREELLAAMRGEVDLMSSNYDTLQTAIDAGDVVPLVVQAVAPIAPTGPMRNCPPLGGANGEAVRRAKLSGRTPEQAEADARAVLDVSDSGILVVGPGMLAGDLKVCVAGALQKAVQADSFRDGARAARRTYEFLDARACAEVLTRAELAVARLKPMLEQAVRRLNY